MSARRAGEDTGADGPAVQLLRSQAGLVGVAELRGGPVNGECSDTVWHLHSGRCRGIAGALLGKYGQEGLAWKRAGEEL